jgi:TPP-dependent pyruvate/acetoin dehydrogenase alpha subunit
LQLGKDDLLKLYRNLVLIRKHDEACIQACNDGLLTMPYYHSGQGSEAVGAGPCTFLRRDDWVLGAARAHGMAQYLSKGLPAKVLMAEEFGRATGCCGGWGYFHLASAEHGIPGMSGTLGSCFVVAAGLGIACKQRGKGQVVVCCFGDGTSNRGTFHEAVNLSALWKLPIVWVCDNNQIAVFTPLEEHFAGKTIADLAYGYNVPGVVVDGLDVVAVCEAVMSAVDRARQGQGPSLVECKTLRLREHCEGLGYLHGNTPVSEEELQEMRRKDPVGLFQEKLLAQGIVTEADIDGIDRQVAAEIEEAVSFAASSPAADVEKLFDPETLYSN